MYVLDLVHCDSVRILNHLFLYKMELPLRRFFKVFLKTHCLRLRQGALPCLAWVFYWKICHFAGIFLIRRSMLLGKFTRLRGRNWSVTIWMSFFLNLAVLLVISLLMIFCFVLLNSCSFLYMLQEFSSLVLFFTWYLYTCVSEPTRQNNGKASILGDATRLLRELLSQVHCLKRENVALLSESHYVSLLFDLFSFLSVGEIEFTIVNN